MGLGGVAIAVLPYVIHPKTAVLGRAGGWDYYLLGENRKSSARRSGGFAIRRKKCSTY